MFLIDISKFYYLPTFRNDFFCLSNFSLLFQECSVVNTVWAISCLGLFPSNGRVSTTLRRFGKTMVEVVHPCEFTKILRKGGFSSHRSTDQCTLNMPRSHQYWDPVLGTWYYPPTTPGKPGTVTTPGIPIIPGSPSSTVTPDESVRPVHTGQKAQLEKADQFLAQSELPILNSPVTSVQLEINVHEPLGNMPTCRLNICQSILKSFKTLRSLTFRMSEQMILLYEPIC